MAQIAQQSAGSVWYPTDGKFTAASAFQRGQAGVTGINRPGKGDKTAYFGTDAFSNPIGLGSERSTPGSPTLTIQNYMTFGRDAIQRASLTGREDYIQVRLTDCGSLDNPSDWDVLMHFGNTRAGDTTVGDPVSREFADARIEQDTVFNSDYVVMWWRQSLTAQTTTETAAANSIWFLDEPDSFADCGNGYPGQGKVGFVACDANGAATANVLYTINGGGTWTALSNLPFAGSEHADFLTGTRISKTQLRLLTGRTLTDGSNPAEIAYNDISVSTGDTTAAWTAVNVGSTNGEVISATLWAKENPNRVYAATDGGEIYLSEDRGATFSEVYTGSNQINAFYEAPGGDIYAVGASGTLLLEKGQSDSFSALTDPTGTNDSYSIAVTEDAIWLGNGTSLFYSRNLEPTATGDWTSSKDFGTNHRVVQISPKGKSVWQGGTSQVLHVVIGDNTGNDGDIWITADGGGFWEEITNLTNADYNDAYFSDIDDNIGWVVGEVSTTAVIHKLAPTTGV